MLCDLFVRLDFRRLTSGGGSTASVGQIPELRNVMIMKRAVEPGISGDRIFQA